MSKLPLSISPCPIIEALVEIRFETELPHDAIFGLFYNSVKDKYPSHEKLFPLQLPDAVRVQDPALKYAPYHKLKSDALFCQIGPRVLTINCPRKYIGWTKYFSEVQRLIELVSDLGVISSVARLGIRYISFFTIDLSQGVNIDLLFRGTSILDKETTIRTLFDSGDFKSFLHFSTNGKLVENNTLLHGSIIDIDTFKNYDGVRFDCDDLLKQIDSGHSEEKRLFFDILNKDFIDSNLNPVYED